MLVPFDQTLSSFGDTCNRNTFFSFLKIERENAFTQHSKLRDECPLHLGPGLAWCSESPNRRRAPGDVDCWERGVEEGSQSCEKYYMIRCLGATAEKYYMIEFLEATSEPQLLVQSLGFTMKQVFKDLWKSYIQNVDWLVDLARNVKWPTVL